MRRKLIIDGNAVYEIDEECTLRKRLDAEREKKERRDSRRNDRQQKRTE